MALNKATFGAGCFWGTDKFFKRQFPLLKTCYTGYLGGKKANPTYEEVCTGETGHAEVIQVEYAPEEVNYKELCHFFFRMHNPCTLNRQEGDVGTQYRSAIFYHDEEQKKIAEEVKDEVQKEHYPDETIVTEISPATEFWKAEDYHQDYLLNNPGGYCCHRIRW
eukprot:TRINITY_DN3289_c0_g1_i1.p1 TRINITY_DN3289_c0_g1~~TRINITY_DN3289_c0_g1_i1.p1  ORF type:complete len:164 (-),score=43.30 TRINITY_DN3289_c0_g1_i1:54-545(-)